ncbi:mitochondrial alternative NADH dehydrogenase 1, putative [Eimeria acervulina]|uniref:NADH:ubiquinone reductase (non-electrogenic) n=1 Tax=Eimeria acervulina TaxID=5801 RepID=U6GHG6_EIMAC|nr:mitochondrial alternative NADH dehydrogenase 1, putative [Eimeria acervulina]CDI79610.1 mitochondrial alternative NADH dehydrogenase 1, putative [Eimeria acervulina]
MNRLRALRYLGGALAASGGGLGSSGVPAACKERGSNGGDKQQQQQQQQQQQPGFLGDWLQKPPAAIGNAAAARWRMRNLLTSLQVRLHLLDLPVSFDEATKKDSVGGQMKEEKREPTTATATTATEAAEAAAAAAAESGKGLQNKKRLRVVVVGGGWSSSSFVSSLDPQTSSSGERGSWEEAYDYLILGVGSEVNTFNIPGVQQHALFLKTAADAERIRGRLKCCLEAAASANISEKERQELLTFVIVGAGPSGVEAAAEIQDFLNTTGARVYPQLQQYFKVVLLEMGSVPLPMYNTQVQQSLGNTFSKSGVDLRLNARVVAVGPSHVQVRRMQPAAAAAVTAAVRDTLTATRGGGASKDSSAAAGGGTSAGGAAAGAAAAAATSPAPATTTTAAAAAATDECIPTRFVLWASAAPSSGVCTATLQSGEERRQS